MRRSDTLPRNREPQSTSTRQSPFRVRTWTGAVALVACAAGLVGEVAAQDSSVDRVREKTLEFVQAIGQKGVDTYIKGRSSDFDRAYKNYHYLVVPGKLEEVQGYIDSSTDDTEKHALTLLRQYLMLHTIRKESAGDLDGGNNYLADTEIVVNATEIPLRDVTRSMGEEPDRSTRRQWSFAYKEFLENANVYFLQSIHLSNEEARAQGYDNYLAFLTEYLGFEIEETRALAESVIASTNESYTSLLEEQVNATFAGELDVDGIRFYDMPLIWRAERFDDALKAKDAFKVAKRTFEKVGLKLNGGNAGDIGYTAASLDHALDGTRGYFDGVARNAFTVGGKPSGSIDALAGSLREAGRMLYHAKAGGSYFEHHFFGDPTMGFAVGYLFQNLLENPAWLKENTKLNDDDVASLIRCRAFSRLFEAREYAVRIVFLPEIYEKDLKQPDEVFESIAEPVRLWGHTEVDRVMYLQSDDNFECVARLQGMILAVGLEKALEGQHGVEWYKNSSVGETLATIWADGSAKSAADYAVALDIPGFDPSLFADHVQETMLAQQ
jgi:hypothetical protein